jgi:hypothetical protein
MPFDPIDYRPPPPPPSEPARPQLSKREETLLIWCICLWLAALFVAPIGGVSIVELIAYLFR